MCIYGNNQRCEGRVQAGGVESRLICPYMVIISDVMERCRLGE